MWENWQMLSIWIWSISKVVKWLNLGFCMPFSRCCIFKLKHMQRSILASDVPQHLPKLRCTCHGCFLLYIFWIHSLRKCLNQIAFHESFKRSYSLYIFRSRHGMSHTISAIYKLFEIGLHHLYGFSLFSYEIEILLSPSYDSVVEINGRVTWKRARCLPPRMHSVYQLRPSSAPSLHAFYRFPALPIQARGLWHRGRSEDDPHGQASNTLRHNHDWVTGSTSRRCQSHTYFENDVRLFIFDTKEKHGGWGI